jgi:hypothetical protein
MVGLAGWTKNEGLMYCIIALSLFIIFIVSREVRPERSSLFRLFNYAGIIAVITVPWLLFKRSFNIVNEDTRLTAINPALFITELRKIPTILYEFQKEFFGPKKWNILWPAAFFTICVRWKAAFAGFGKYIGLSIVFSICGYVLVYLSSHLEIGFFVSKTWSRFLLHFLPVTIYWVAYTLREDHIV